MKTPSFKQKSNKNKVDELKKNENKQRQKIPNLIMIAIINIIKNTTTSRYAQRNTSKVKVAHISKKTTYVLRSRKLSVTTK